MYGDYPNWCDLSRPDFVKYMIGDCAIRISPAISRPFYDSDISSPYGQTYARKQVLGYGSLHFPLPSESTPYISFESNVDLKYIDGEVVTGKFYFRETKYDKSMKTFEGTINFDKDI